MDSQRSLNNYLEGALMAALAVAIALIGFYIPLFQFITVLIWLVPIVVVAVRKGFNISILALTTACILLMFLAPVWGAFLYIVQFAGLGLVFSYYFHKKESFSKILMVGTIVVAISTVIIFLISFWVTGVNLTDIHISIEETANTVIAAYENMGLLDTFQEQGLTQEEIKKTITSMVSLVARLMPATMVIYGMAVAFLSYFIIRMTLQKLSLPVSEIPVFHKWQIPWYFVWGVIIGLALILYADFTQWETGSTIGMNIIYLYLPVLLIQGLSVAIFFYKKWNMHILLKVLLLAIIVLNIPVTLMLLLILGLFDPLFNYRKIEQNVRENS
jgi:uncharacterized protein YybS (DUF2232 family)